MSFLKKFRMARNFVINDTVQENMFKFIQNTIKKCSSTDLGDIINFIITFKNQRRVGQNIQINNEPQHNTICSSTT